MSNLSTWPVPSVDSPARQRLGYLTHAPLPHHNRDGFLHCQGARREFRTLSTGSRQPGRTASDGMHGDARPLQDRPAGEQAHGIRFGDVRRSTRHAFDSIDPMKSEICQLCNGRGAIAQRVKVRFLWFSFYWTKTIHNECKNVLEQGSASEIREWLGH